MHEDDALRAVRAAAEIGEALAVLNADLELERGFSIRFRTGVNTGEVVVGDPATGTTLITGDTVNTAARLEQGAPPGGSSSGGSHTRSCAMPWSRRPCSPSPRRARPSRWRRIV